MVITVGGVAYQCESETSVDITATNTTYAFVSPDENPHAGEIAITYSQTEVTGLFIKKIIVNPEPAQKLVMSTISCTEQTSSTLRFAWDAVTGAVDYEVSSDGTTYTSTNNTPSYTLSALEPDTDYTIWVKAIGDGLDYTTSDPKQSATGRTDVSSGDTPVLGSEVVSTFKDKNLNIIESNDMSWTSSEPANSFESASPSRGVQFGAAIGSFTITGTGYTDGVQSIKMVVSTNGTANANKISVKVNGFTIGSEIALPKENNQTIEFTSPTVLTGGDIVITVNDSNKSVYFKSITIN